MKQIKFTDINVDTRYLDGAEGWYERGQLHRNDDLPAISYEDKKEWYQNGLLHRENGPAIENLNGKNSWYLEDRNITEENFLKWQIKNNKHPIQKLHKSFQEDLNNNNKDEAKKLKI